VNARRSYPKTSATVFFTATELQALAMALVVADGEDEGKTPWTRDDSIMAQARQRIWRKLATIHNEGGNR
jgi:hypothetical protein